MAYKQELPKLINKTLKTKVLNICHSETKILTKDRTRAIRCMTYVEKQTIKVFRIHREYDEDERKNV